MSGVAAAADEHRRRESWSELIFRCIVSAILGFSTHLALLSILHFFGALSIHFLIIFSVGVLLIAITVGQFVRQFFGVHASPPAVLAFNIICMWIAFISVIAEAQEVYSPLLYILFNGVFALVLNSFFRMLFRDDSTKED
ncbi:uncharacterized protein LOC141638960 [Silene latifolia]|uniref:uncharacterized protein LOC141638960 n=1 Tax=Silene latifolia TaxID=37657 RepID=UPI003D776ACB